MKEYNAPSSIGEGLFSEEPIEVQINFPDGKSATFKLHAMTQEILVELEKDKVKFEGYSSQAEALNHSSRIIRRIVVGGQYEGVEIRDELIGRILSNVGLTQTLLEAARSLAEEQQEAEEGNSES